MLHQVCHDQKDGYQSAAAYPNSSIRQASMHVSLILCCSQQFWMYKRAYRGSRSAEQNGFTLRRKPEVAQIAPYGAEVALLCALCCCQTDATPTGRTALKSSHTQVSFSLFTLRGFIQLLAAGSNKQTQS